MKENERIIKWLVFDQDELSGNDLILVNRAKEATDGSWSPYSGFKVGAALMLDDGTVVTGSNQEMPHTHRGFAPKGPPCLPPDTCTPTRR